MILLLILIPQSDGVEQDCSCKKTISVSEAISTFSSFRLPLFTSRNPLLKANKKGKKNVLGRDLSPVSSFSPLLPHVLCSSVDVTPFERRRKESRKKC